MVLLLTGSGLPSLNLVVVSDSKLFVWTICYFDSFRLQIVLGLDFLKPSASCFVFNRSRGRKFPANINYIRLRFIQHITYFSPTVSFLY